MELLIAWIISIGITKIMKMLMGIVSIKDIARSGYKINMDKLKDAQERLQDTLYQRKMFDYIPF